MHRAIAAVHRQIEWRADFGIWSNRGEWGGKLRGIAQRPDHDGARFTQGFEIDPRRAGGFAVDQNLRLIR